MIKNNVKESLSDKIANILNTAPADFDPDDEDFDNTRAQLIDTNLFDNEDEEVLLGKFRKQNVDLLADIDQRYAGVKTSRKEYFGSDEESVESGEPSEEKNQCNEEVSEDNNEESKSEKSSFDENEQNTDLSSEDDKDDEDSISENSDIRTQDENSLVAEESNFTAMKQPDLSFQQKKGLCVRNQMSMWENLLEMRIQLQKCLITANKMPQKQTFMEIKKCSGQEFSNQVAITKNSVTKLLEKLLLLQKLVLKRYPETKKLDQTKQKDLIGDGDGDEIPSDTDEEKSAEEFSEEDEEPVAKKKRKLIDFVNEINEHNEKYKSYRNSVIQKWHEKTRFAVLKNDSNAHSVIKHIEHILSNKTKLVKRTQLKRSEYTILGEEPADGVNEQPNEENQGNRRLEEYNPEIFDDDDFYHQLLRELIEVKSADLTDPVQLGRQWIQLQNMRSKMKRKIDTKATKGRKIRYVVHPKLVNFMAPIDENMWTEETKKELCNSLFGKKDYLRVV